MVLVLFFGLIVKLFRLDLGLLVFGSTLVESAQPWWALESKVVFFMCKCL